MGFFSWLVSDRKWEKQEQAWKASGRYPRIVVRTYDDDELYQRDASRLVDLGFEIVSQSVNTRMLGLWPSHTKVTYRHSAGGSVLPVQRP